MTHEPWADSQLSEALLRLSQAGESETVEFKRELPRQVRDLAKEIAAFASTSGGVLIVGVEDEGKILGIPNAHTPAVRDDFERRIVGVCQMIEPPVKPKITWASTGGLCVMAIIVEKGSEPLYYVESRAYIRHASVSRPATPVEVRAALLVADSEAASQRPSMHSELSALADVLTSVRCWCEMDQEMRGLETWLDQWTHAADRYASELRDLSISEWARSIQVVERLDEAAEKLDEVVQFTHYIGSGGDFDLLCKEVGAVAEQLMHDLVDSVAVSEETQREVFEAITTHARKLIQMWNRAQKDVFSGQVERAQKESYEIGQQIAKWTYFKLSLLPDEGRLALRRIGHELLQLASMRSYFDGGESLNRIVKEAKNLIQRLETAVSSFP